MKILNEEKYAEELIKKGFILKKYDYELKILAKYYYSKGIKEDELKNKIKDFCKLNISKFNEIKSFKMIKRAVKYGHTNSLFIVKPIRITKAEIDKIKELDNLKLEKIAFTLLVLSNINKQSYTLYMKDKLRNLINENNKKKNPIEYKELCKDFPNISRGYFVNEKMNSIFKTARVYVKKDEKQAMLKELIDKEFITMSKKCSFKINFIQHNVKKTEIIINNFEDFILEYEKIKGDNIGQCAEAGCNKLIRITSNRKMYCNECWKEKHKEQDRIYQRNKYSRLLENTL